MTDIQTHLLDMLKELDEICKKHNITYYLIGGSALGAIRHHGFIPWDDDADITMTWDNWLKFESIIDKELRPDRRLMTWKRTPDYPAVFARYSNVTTTCIVNSLSYSPITWGLMIDIFILTPIPNEEKARTKFHNYMKLYGELVNPFFPVNPNTRNFQYELLYFLSVIFGKRKVLEYITGKIYGYEESQCTHYSYSYPRVHVIYEKSIFQAPRYIPFEDTLLPVPTNVEEHLRILFGETWMLLPKKQNQISEHRMVVDLLHSYDYYTDDYLLFSPYEKIMKSYRKWKSWRIRVLSKNNYRKISNIKFEYLKDALEWDKFWNTYESQILYCYEMKQYNEISVLFKKSYPLFCKKEYLENKLIPTVTDIQLEILLYMLNRDGFYHIVPDLCQTLASRKKKLNINCRRLSDLAQTKQSLMVSFTDSDKCPDKTFIRKLLTEYPEDYTLLLLYLHCVLTTEDADWTDIKVMIDRGLSNFPYDGAFQKYLGDYLLAQGNPGAAKEQYKIAKSYLRNGLLLQEIELSLDKGITNE